MGENPSQLSPSRLQWSWYGRSGGQLRAQARMAQPAQIALASDFSVEPERRSASTDRSGKWRREQGSDDNASGTASGWNHSQLSESGRDLAGELGDRRRDDGLAAVLTSDLRRAVETADIALLIRPFRSSGTGDFGSATTAEETACRRPSSTSTRLRTSTSPTRAGSRGGKRFSGAPRSSRTSSGTGAGQRVLVIGHVATRWSLDHMVDGVPLEQLVSSDFGWQLGWEYRLRG